MIRDERVCKYSTVRGHFKNMALSARLAHYSDIDYGKLFDYLISSPCIHHNEISEDLLLCVEDNPLYLQRVAHG
jgi:hypothetical protein